MTAKPMISKIKILIGILVIGIILICGLLISNNQPIPIQQSKYIEISIDEKFERISNIHLPIDKTEAEIIVKKFCESKNPDYSYGYDIMKKVGNEWKVQIVNMNGLCYAAVNVKSGETNCEKCDDVKLFPPFEQVTITTDKTEYEEGETVKIIVKNGLDKSIWHNGVPGICENAFSIGLKKDDYKEFHPLATAWCIASVEELKSHSETVFELNLDEYSINEFTGYNIKLPVTYKLEFNYAFSKKDSWAKEEKVYSNEFTIREKSALDLRCSEKISGVGPCEVEKLGYEFDLNKRKCVGRYVTGCSLETPFNSLEECWEVCEEKLVLDLLCSKKVVGKGDCPGAFLGYEFDQSKETCVEKGVSGCSIETPFNSLEECQRVCEKKENVILPNEDELVKCNNNSDCVLVNSNCCPCRAGGGVICINKKYFGDWDQKLDCRSEIGGLACPTVYLCDDNPTGCRCMDNACKGVRE